MNMFKRGRILAVVAPGLFLMTGCNTPGLSDQAKAPVGSSESGRFGLSENEVTVWNWCDRGTKVYLAVLPYKGVSVSTSPGHKDCQ